MMLQFKLEVMSHVVSFYKLDLHACVKIPLKLTNWILKQYNLVILSHGTLVHLHPPLCLSSQDSYRSVSH